MASMKYGEAYLQSPIDDFFSFFYTAQWAAIFNDKPFDGAKSVPARLADWRSDIGKSHASRDSVTFVITDQENPLSPAGYGTFLNQLHPFLAQWWSKLAKLRGDWRTSLGSIEDCDAASLEKLFQKFTDRAVVDLIEVGTETQML